MNVSLRRKCYTEGAAQVCSPSCPSIIAGPIVKCIGETWGGKDARELPNLRAYFKENLGALLFLEAAPCAVGTQAGYLGWILPPASSFLSGCVPGKTCVPVECSCSDLAHLEPQETPLLCHKSMGPSKSTRVNVWYSWQGSKSEPC